jgi:CheY-like chemotaxis protein
MSARILVVDDNEVNVELLVTTLVSEHYVVSTAVDGFEDHRLSPSRMAQPVTRARPHVVNKILTTSHQMSKFD